MGVEARLFIQPQRRRWDRWDVIIIRLGGIGQPAGHAYVVTGTAAAPKLGYYDDRKQVTMYLPDFERRNNLVKGT